jgi:putative salt-induced outer membrane protein
MAQALDWREGEWKGHADLGYSAANGNSESENLNAALGLVYSIGVWKHSLEFAAFREENEGSLNAERYQTQAKSKYALSDVSYVFGALIYEFDEFGGVRERSSETLGYGRQLWLTDIHSLEAELGLGARQSEMQDGMEEDEAIVRAGLTYHRHLSESASFNQGLLVEAGDSNTYVESISALKLSIVGNLFAKLGYTIKYNDTVPAGVETTDTYTNVNLSYEF